MTPPNQSMKSWRSVNHLGPCILAISLLWSASAIATENFAGFCHIDTSGEPPEATARDWGPVQTDKASIANLSPVLLPFFNNGPVFGLPGTVVGDFWQNTQLTGDWGGFRTSLKEHGIFFDLIRYECLPGCGLRRSQTKRQFFRRDVQPSINIDTGRAGLWPGGLFIFTVGSRFGDSGQKIVSPRIPRSRRTPGSASPGPLPPPRDPSSNGVSGSGADAAIQSSFRQADDRQLAY